MIERTLRYPEYLGLIGALYDLCDLIAEVYAAPFSRMVDRNTAARIGQLRMINGVLNPDRTLCPDFRSVLDDVMKGRRNEALSQVDVESISSRCEEWHRPYG